MKSSNVVVFNKTVTGYGHFSYHEKCQDSSISYSNDSYQIIAVADGHGDPHCRRSDRGSKFAVEVAKCFLQKLANNILISEEELTSKDVKKKAIATSKEIIKRWQKLSELDLTEHPVSDGQASSLLLYGSTLITCLRVDHFVILIQQGDGRANVFYSDGRIEQPVAWDERCEGTTTSSLCDKDAFEHIRTTVINADDIIAVFLGTDGIDASYYENEDQEGTFRFYKDLVCAINAIGPDSAEIENLLENSLPVFSRAGCGDDISVAGIVNIDGLSQHISKYQKQVQYYDTLSELKLELKNVSNKLISMDRKHNFLLQNLKETEQELKHSNVINKQANRSLQIRQNEAERLKKSIQKEQLELLHNIDSIVRLYDSINKRRYFPIINIFIASLLNVTLQKENQIEELYLALSNTTLEIKQYETERDTAKKRIQALKKAWNRINRDYTAYHHKYKELEQNKRIIEGKLAKLNKEEA